MSNRIETRLDKLKAEGKKALITFITAGYGGYETTEQAILEMEKSGADIVEIGVPFSDPIAEGPVIQTASVHALASGTTLAGIFSMVKRLRTRTDMPLVLMMYVNTIFRYGTEKFFSQCKEYGIDGVIVPDIPYEEFDEISGEAEKNGVLQISLVTPVSFERIEKIASNAKGFLYCVSSTGVTGTRSSFSTNFSDFFENIKKHSNVPNMLGFGISGPEQAQKLKDYCDGIIVGSAIVKLIDENQPEETVKRISNFTAELRKALDI